MKNGIKQKQNITEERKMPVDKRKDKTKELTKSKAKDKSRFTEGKATTVDITKVKLVNTPKK